MLQLLVAPVSHRRRSRSTASFLHPLGAVLVRRPPRVRLRRSLLAAAAAPAALERRWRPLHSVAASAAFARPSFDLRSVCGPEFTEPGFAVGRFRTQGTDESSQVALLVVISPRGFNPLKLEILLSWESARLSPTKRTSRSSSSSICRSSHLRTTTRSIRVRIAPLFAHVVLLLFLHF